MGSFLTDVTTCSRQAVRAVLATMQLNLFLKRFFLNLAREIEGNYENSE